MPEVVILFAESYPLEDWLEAVRSSLNFFILFSQQQISTQLYVYYLYTIFSSSKNIILVRLSLKMIYR
jgi:hypothetical protein